jgi:hypothetical protein
MRKIIYFATIVILYSCDPSESLETKIINYSNSDLDINFVSRLIIENNQSNKESFKIESGNSITYGRLNVTGGLGNAGLSLIDFDSIYISTNNNEIVKIWKIDSEGKNIYDIANFWTVKETSKDNYVYTFEITDKDIE